MAASASVVSEGFAVLQEWGVSQDVSRSYSSSSVAFPFANLRTSWSSPSTKSLIKLTAATFLDQSSVDSLGSYLVIVRLDLIRSLFPSGSPCDLGSNLVLFHSTRYPKSPF